MATDKKDKNYNSEISKEDIDMIGKKERNLRADGDDDQQLKNREEPVDFEGKDLDVPGRTLPEEGTKKKLKDEENQLYSQGGPGNESLEQNPAVKRNK